MSNPRVLAHTLRSCANNDFSRGKAILLMTEAAAELEEQQKQIESERELRKRYSRFIELLKDLDLISPRTANAIWKLIDGENAD